jgi:nitrogenase-associated protein
MAEVSFYEKPGCINNTRQKKLLTIAGHRLKVYNLLEYEWDSNSLRKYFGELSVVEWFNPSAPAIKEGWVDPATLDEDSALKLMLRDPLLIRRPLMRVGDEYMAGFDAMAVHEWIGLDRVDQSEDLESCTQM